MNVCVCICLLDKYRYVQLQSTPWLLACFSPVHIVYPPFHNGNPGSKCQHTCSLTQSDKTYKRASELLDLHDYENTTYKKEFKEHFCRSTLPLLWEYTVKMLSSNVPWINLVCLFVFLKIIYLFLAVLCLCCCAQAFSSCGEQGLLFIVVCGLLIAVASLVVEHGL